MFDMSWGEIMVIGGVALVVIPPKDLPKALRTLGQMTTKVRRMASEFHGQFNEAMREAELHEVKKEVEGLNRSVSAATAAAFNPIQTIRDEIRTAGEPKTTAAADDPDIWGTNPGPIEPLGEPPGAPVHDVGLPPVEEVGPVPHIEPLGLDASPALPDLPPFPPEPPARPEPPVPATASNDTMRDTAPDDRSKGVS